MKLAGTLARKTHLCKFGPRSLSYNPFFSCSAQCFVRCKKCFPTNKKKKQTRKALSEVCSKSFFWHAMQFSSTLKSSRSEVRNSKTSNTEAAFSKMEWMQMNLPFNPDHNLSVRGYNVNVWILNVMNQCSYWVGQSSCFVTENPIFPFVQTSMRNKSDTFFFLHPLESKYWAQSRSGRDIVPFGKLRGDSERQESFSAEWPF